MLVDFTFGNFKSFKEEQKISFEASKITRHRTHVGINGKKRILKNGIVYGANAAGKSNLIKAIDFSKRIIIDGIDNVDLSKCHFRIDNDMYKKPGKFEYRIILENIEYIYGIEVSYCNRIISGEWLYKIENSGKKIIVFKRVADDKNISKAFSEVKFSSKEDKIRMDFCLESFSEGISDAYKKKTILSDIALRITEKDGVFTAIRNIYEWFNKIIILFPNSKYNGINEIAVEKDKKDIFMNVLKYFDTGIESIETEEQQMDFDKVLENIPRQQAEEIKIDISNKVNEHPVMLKFGGKVFELRKDENGNIVYNVLKLDHGNKMDLFEYGDESDGTKRLFDLIPLFYEMENAGLIVIDEVDRSLHTNLIRKFYEIIFDILVGLECQMIATTYDTNLLDLDTFRQDEIWFVKRKSNHSSYLKSLNTFNERFDKKVEKEYLSGKYGGVPRFEEGQNNRI